jgi:predicted dehydrogenase
MSTPHVRLGFVGVGNMGQAAHLRNFAMVPHCEIVAIADVRSTHATSVARKWGVPHVYTAHQQMMHAHPEIDALVAIQPFTRHGSLIPELLAYGKPILTEKPIAGAIAQGEAIVAAMHAHNTWMMVGYHKRSDPATIYAKAEIDRLKQSGELGKMNYIRILMASTKTFGAPRPNNHLPKILRQMTWMLQQTPLTGRLSTTTFIRSI